MTEIKEFPDGVVIHYPQLLGRSPLKWPEAILWIPYFGNAGILMPQPKQLSDEEWQAYQDRRSYWHHIAISTLFDIIDWLFKDQNQLPDGTTKEQVAQMTQFKQIELLERISKDTDLLGNTRVEFGEICRFVEDVDKNGFKTADDFASVSAKLASRP